MKGLILIVEDNKTMVELLNTRIKQRFGSARTEAISFKDAPEAIRQMVPDLIVLDLYDEGVDDEPAAGPAWKAIWDDHFCPVVIHSAKDAAAYREKENPYVRYEIKAKDSVEKVMEHIQKFGGQIQKLKELRMDFIKRTGEALRETSTLLAKKGEDLTPAQEEIVIRSARRRVAATFDDIDKHEYGWERYVFPPLSPDLLMGDILLEVGQNPANPASFRLILTPSCDLVPGRNGSVTEALLAGCGPFQDFQTAANLKDRKEKDLRERLPKELNRDQVAGFVPVPGLDKVFPTMSADMRKLALVPVGDIGLKPEGKRFVRMASLDSPFREKLMWAYVQIAGRPATPDFDATKWVDEIVKAQGEDKS